MNIINKMINQGVVAVIRATSKEEAVNIIKAVSDGGIKVVEITMTVPGAIDIIKEVIDLYKDDENMIIGAGTVLDSETARTCILAGASFIVSPSLNEETIKICNRYRVPIIPGVFTPTELQKVLDLGVDIAKIFPGNVAGLGMINSLKGPYPQANLMPSGGVSLDNIETWVKAGALMVSAGSDLTKGAKTGDFDAVKNMAIKFKETYNTALELCNKPICI